MKYYRCGKILTTHGLKGEVKVASYSDFDRFSKGNTLFILHKEEYVEVKVESVKDFGKYLIVSFAEFTDINEVMKFHSDDIFIREDMREETLLENEYYYSDLIGKEVINTSLEPRGVVLEVKELPQCDYLYIRWNGRNFYVPFLDEFIEEVSDKIIIKEKEGLFNEN